MFMAVASPSTRLVRDRPGEKPARFLPELATSYGDARPRHDASGAGVQVPEPDHEQEEHTTEQARGAMNMKRMHGNEKVLD